MSQIPFLHRFQTPLKRTDFKAYGPEGELLLHVFTTKESTYYIEKSVFQERLDKGDLMWVDIVGPHGYEKLIPRLMQEDIG